MQTFSIGNKVVFNDLPHATVFEVIRREGQFSLYVREYKEDDTAYYREQEVDVSMCKRPTGLQLFNHAMSYA